MFRLSRKTQSNIAQVIICVLLFPFLCIVLNIVFPDKSVTQVFLELIKSLPIMEIWFDLLTDFKDFEQLIYDLEAMEGEYEFYIFYSLYQVYAIAVLIGIINSLSSKLGWKGLRIIPTIVAVLFACILQKVTGEDITILLFEGITLMVIYIVVLFFVSKTAVIKTVIMFAIELYFSFYIAIFSTMYIAVLGLICLERISGLANIVISVVSTFLGLLISSGLSYLVSPRK